MLEISPENAKLLRPDTMSCSSPPSDLFCASAPPSLLRGLVRSGADLRSCCRRVDEGLMVGPRSGLGNGQGQQSRSGNEEMASGVWPCS